MKRHAQLQRGKALPVKRKGSPRRTRSPLPLPPVDGSPATLHGDEGEAVAFGVQAELCRATMCAACFAVSWMVMHASLDGSTPPVDWTQLPAAPHGLRSEAHHEPPRGLRSASDDDDTIPLCKRHHGRKGSPARRFAVRHGTRFDHDAEGFYIAANVGDWRAVRDEMRRRTKSSAACAAGGEPGGAYPPELVPVVGEPGPVTGGGPAPASVPASTWLPPETARSRR